MGWFNSKTKKDVQTAPVSSDELWQICPSCSAHIYKTDWLANIKVCTNCNYHERLSAWERIDLMIDKGTFRELSTSVSTSDPLNFSDAKGKYLDKAALAKKKTGLKESIVTGSGDLNGTRIVLGVMDFGFLGGSLASGTGEKIAHAANHALYHKRPLVIFSASGGARMHEGIVSLMQMAKTCAAIEKLHKAGIPYISVMTDPTTGGVSASFAMIGDIHIAEPKALIGFAGRRVIENTIKQKLPDDFQTAEYLNDHGFVDAIVKRKDMKEYISSVIGYWNH
jgi:acetyl-CoA carboxylase carboxyl transferase subunit beta